MFLKRDILVKAGLFAMLLTFAAFRVSAQSGSYSNLEFVENKGQWDTKVKFRAEVSGGAFFLHKNGFTIVQSDSNDLRYFSEMSHHDGNRSKPSRPFGTAAGDKATAGSIGAGSPPVIHSHAYRVSFVNANEDAEVVPDKPLPSYNNYLLGNDPSKWAGNCKIYQGITYKNIYPGVDLRYYTNEGQLKYDLVVHPGADPTRIALKYEGQDKLSLRKGQIVVKTSVNEVKEALPHSFQLNETGKRDLDCQYVLGTDNTVRFKLRDYAPDQTLVIDPSIIFCSFTGSTADNWGFTATYGPDGSMFVGGIVAGIGFPVSTGAFKTSTSSGQTRADYWDVGLMKFSANGSTRVYATYLGGNGNEYPHSLVVDNSGELIVMGRTYSTDFPLYPAGNLVGPGGGADIFMTKLNAAGTAPIGSMRIGGKGADGVNVADQGEEELAGVANADQLQGLIRNYGDWSRSEVILDASGTIYAAACTQSSDFPLFGSGFQSTLQGSQDGVILKINPSCTSVLASSFIGGSGADATLVLDINPINNNIYIGGSTTSPDFPGMTIGTPQQSTFRGTINGFVSIIGNNGNTLSLLGSTYLSSPTANTIDMIYGVKFDKLGFPYVMGTSTGNWPVVGAAYSNAGAKQFIAKLKPDLSAIVYSTVFGTPGASKPNISPVAFLVDRCENVYISGWGGWYSAVSVTYPDPYFLQGTTGMPVTPDAAKATTDNRDFYFIVLKRDASNILYGTFFGETDNNYSISEHVDGGTSRYDKNGVIYQGICANCYHGDPNNKSADNGYIPFPTTPGVWSPHNGTGTRGCNLAGLKIAFNFAGVSAGLKATLKGRGDSLGCIPLDATLQDTIRNAKSYIWYFGDGTGDTTTSYIVNHTYTQVGTYLVTLIAIDSTTCNISDTVTMHITARNNPANLAFNFSKNGPCTSSDYEFHNLSTYIGVPFTDTSFIWNFGDGSGNVTTGTADVEHSFAPGPYNVSLILQDTNYCNAPDTLVKPLYVAQNVKAQFVTPATGCAPEYVTFENTSIAGQQYYWDFGDGTTDTINRTPPPHFYPNPGTYTISLKVIDSTTCNIESDTSVTITLYGKPTAGFSFQPTPPVANTPDVFNNSSSNGAIRFKWIFGDGDTALRTSMDTVIHQYISTDTFEACLVAFNEQGCSDTACHPVAVLINPLLDVPNAFTPGRFGQNAIVKVMGFGITHMIWRIYNRWGQLVFESDDPNMGWDGTYKGVVQPMDVYAYTLEAEFSNKTHVTKKGDITLIR